MVIGCDACGLPRGMGSGASRNSIEAFQLLTGSHSLWTVPLLAVTISQQDKMANLACYKKKYSIVFHLGNGSQPPRPSGKYHSSLGTRLPAAKESCNL